MNHRGRPRRFRSGITLIETTVVLVVIAILLLLSLPTLGRLRERGRRLACQANLRQIGQCIERYRTADPAQAYPRGATFDADSQTSGTSWWLEIMPYSDMRSVSDAWLAAPAAGDFSTAVNPNTTAIDGYRQSIFFCPSSPLPRMCDPTRYVFELNRKLPDGRAPQGIAVPMYVAVAGGAPDAVETDLPAMISKPHGRNTQDGRYGILSSSGVMPVNLKIADAAVRDPKSKTIMIVEQSAYVRNHTLDPPDLYDVRSAWPRGFLMGSTGNYGPLHPTGDGVNATGAARVWNVTTIRYPVNHRQALDQPGIVVDPAPPRPAKEDDPPPPLPPYPPEGFGPGHNHGVLSGHPEGAHVLMADGSTFFLNEKIDLPLLLELSTRDDGRDSSDLERDDL